MLVLAFFPTEADSPDGIVWSSLNYDSAACNKEMEYTEIVAEINELEHDDARQKYELSKQDQFSSFNSLKELRTNSRLQSITIREVNSLQILSLILITVISYRIHWSVHVPLFAWNHCLVMSAQS